MLGVETSLHSFLTSTPDADIGQFRHRPLVGTQSYSRHLGEDKFSCTCREILVEKRATKVWYVFDLSCGCHTFRPSHLPWFERPKNVR